MSAEITIRPGRPEDAEEIARVYVETWRDTYAGVLPGAYLVAMTEAGQAVRWETMLRQGGAERALVAERRGPRGVQVVGFGSCGRARAGPCEGEVYTLYVAGDYQGQGAGRRLLSGLFSSLADRGHDDALVWVLSANPARYFYETLGGSRVAERRESFAGTRLEETAYGWFDLPAWLAAQGEADRRRAGRD